MSRDFNKFRFEGLNYHTASKSYWSMNRINEEETKCIVNLAEEQVVPTRYGYAVILDRTHVVFVKDWQVSRGMYGKGYEVMFTEQYYTVKEWGNHEDFATAEHLDTFADMLAAAKEQEATCFWAR